MAKNYVSIGGYTYEILKISSAKGEALNERYKQSLFYHGCRRLWDCYERPSYAKETAYDICVKMVSQFDYFTNVTVIGYNCMQFSFGAYVKRNNLEYIMYITKDHNYLIEL